MELPSGDMDHRNVHRHDMTEAGALASLPPLWPPSWVWHIAAYSLLPVTGGVLLARSYVRNEMHAAAGSARSDGLGLIALGCVGLCCALVGLLFSSGLTVVGFYLPALFASPFMGPAAIPIALALFALRERRLALYGLLEIAGGCATVLYTGVVRYPSTEARAAALLGAMYFLVRGLDNAKKGGLWAKLRALLGWSVGTGRTAAALLLAALVAPFAVLTARSLPESYAAGWWGNDRLASNSECGGFLVVCDEAAWRHHAAASSRALDWTALSDDLPAFVVAILCMITIGWAIFRARRTR